MNRAGRADKRCRTGFKRTELKIEDKLFTVKYNPSRIST
jgi:hypothetical protein